MSLEKQFGVSRRVLLLSERKEVTSFQGRLIYGRGQGVHPFRTWSSRKCYIRIYGQSETGVFGEQEGGAEGGEKRKVEEREGGMQDSPVL